MLVTDGFTGNVVLKTLEGFGDLLHSMLMSAGRCPLTEGNGHGQLWYDDQAHGLQPIWRIVFAGT